MAPVPQVPIEAHLIATDDFVPSTAAPSEASESASALSSARSKASRGEAIFSSKKFEVPESFPVRRGGSTTDVKVEQERQKLMSVIGQVDVEVDVKLEELLPSFTHKLQQGVEMCVLLDDGKLLDVEVSLDSDMTRIVLGVKEVTRDILFEEIERVAGPEEAEESCTTNSEHISDCCTTLVLSSTHFLTFSFATQRHREYFEVCFRGVLAQHKD